MIFSGVHILISGRTQRQARHRRREIHCGRHAQSRRVFQFTDLAVVYRQTSLDHCLQAVDEELGVVQIGLVLLGEGTGEPPQTAEAKS